MAAAAAATKSFDTAFKESNVNRALQIRRHGPLSAWLLSEVCRQLVLSKVPAKIPVENLSAAMTLVSLDSPLWVKQRRTRCEQMSSGLPLKADIAQCSRHVSKVPMGDIAC
jgi:hypothetical protein